MQPHLEYDAESDVLYLHLGSGEVRITQELGDFRNVDIAGDGAVIGIEFVDASAGIDLRDVPCADVVEALIRDSGLEFPVFA